MILKFFTTVKAGIMSDEEWKEFEEAAGMPLDRDLYERMFSEEKENDE